MGTIEASELFKQWKLEDLTVEMAVGHIIQHLTILHEVDEAAGSSRTQMQRTLEEHRRELIRLRKDVDRLLQQVGLSPEEPSEGTAPSSKPKRKPRQKKE